MRRIDRAIRAYRASAKKPDGERPKVGKKGQEEIHGLIRENSGGVKRAARFLMQLDQEEAAGIMRHLSVEEIEKITREIADSVETGGGAEGKPDIQRNSEIKSSSSRGGALVAKGMLINSFGEERGMELYRRAVPIEIDNPFDFLDDLDFQQILMILKREPDSVISVILPYLDSRKASNVLEALPPEFQMRIVKRVARMQKISPDALMKVAEALREKIRKQGRLITEEIDGPQVLAEILGNMPSSVEDGILEKLDSFDPALVESIRDKLYTIELIFQLSERDLQSILGEYSEEEIAIILKGKTDEVRGRMLDNISERRCRFVIEEGERLGPMRRNEVDRTTREFVQYIRELAEEGLITLFRDSD